MSVEPPPHGLKIVPAPLSQSVTRYRLAAENERFVQKHDGIRFMTMTPSHDSVPTIINKKKNEVITCGHAHSLPLRETKIFTSTDAKRLFSQIQDDYLHTCIIRNGLKSDLLSATMLGNKRQVLVSKRSISGSFKTSPSGIFHSQFLSLDCPAHFIKNR